MIFCSHQLFSILPNSLSFAERCGEEKKFWNFDPAHTEPVTFMRYHGSCFKRQWQSNTKQDLRIHGGEDTAFGFLSLQPRK
jgi:hypothetical protein